MQNKIIRKENKVMITEDFCSFEVAKLLKERGFDYQGFDYIDFEGEVIRQDRPTHQMAMKWLREVHNLHIDIDPSEGDWNPTVITLEDWSCVVKFGDNIPIQDTYEEAVEAALKYTLENLI